MPYTPEGKKIMLEALSPDKVSLHTGDPSTTGANEVTGGEYARQTIEWNAPSAGSMDDKTNGAVFKVPSGAAVKYVGFWKSSKFVASDDVTEETFGAAGIYTLEDADLDLNS